MPPLGHRDDAFDDHCADGAGEARSTDGSCVECGATADLDADPFNPGAKVCEACWVATVRPCVECRVAGLTGRVEGHPEWHFCDGCWDDMTYMRRRRVHPPARAHTPAPSGLHNSTPNTGLVAGCASD